MWKELEICLCPSVPERPTLRYHLQTIPRRSSTSLFYGEEAYQLPAVVLVLERLGEDLALSEVQNTLAENNVDGVANLHPTPFLVKAKDGTSKKAVWIAGLNAAQGLQLKNKVGSVSGLFLASDEQAFVLGEANPSPLFLHPLPRIVSHEKARIADNTDYPLSMERLLHNFVHRFSDDEAHTLPHVDIATAFLYQSGLQYVIRLLKNERIKTLRLLCSGKADKGAVALLEQVFVQPLEEQEDSELAPEYKLLYQAVEEGRFQLQVYPHAFLHAKLYLGYDFIDNHGFVSNWSAVIGSSNVSASGILPRGNLELNATVENKNVVTELYRWFEARWEEAEDPRPALLEILDHKAQQITPPEFQVEGLLDVWKLGRQKKLEEPEAYLTFLARLYRKQIALTPDALLLPPYPHNEARQIVPSPEQESGVLALANRLLQLRLAFLADSVGLGKTVTALGTAWYLYRLQQAQKIAVIAPRKLMNQWRHDAQNICMPADLLHYVNRHSLERCSEEEAASRLASYDLLLVEEAHESLRNRKNKLWNHLRRHLQKHPRCRLLLISATPWNNKREDIFNYILLGWQDGLSLFLDYPTLQEPSFYRNLQWFRGQPSAAARTFEGLSLESYRAVFDTTFVQRTRHRIAQMYQGSFDFPDRNVLPYYIPASEAHDTFYDQLRKALEVLNIPYRQPFLALQRAASRVLPELPDSLREVPESSLHRGFLIQLYKRAESSLFALAVSLQNIVRRLEEFEKELAERVYTSKHPKQALREWLNKVYLQLEAEALGEAGLDFLDEDLLSTAEKARYGQLQALFAELDDDTIKLVVQSLIHTEVEDDHSTLQGLRAGLTMSLEKTSPKNLLLLDLSHLHVEHQRKVVMIGSYTDTVVRTFLRLVAAHPEQRIGMALGGDEGWVYDPHQCHSTPLTAAEWGTAIGLHRDERRKALLHASGRARQASRSNVIRAFAPRAQNVSATQLQNLGGELDILLGTEAISMGQNLQDATSLIHLDMPWNPMVLEQRIGRVDRRGGGRLSDPSNPNSPKVVDIYYCWSPVAIENEIALRDKLKTKSENAIQDTNFDELLLYELRDLIEQVRHNQQNLSDDIVDPQVIASFLDKRQQSLADEQSVPQDIAPDGGSYLDGIRRLAQWAQQAEVDLDLPATPVVASGQSAASDEGGRWLVTIALQPRSAAGHVLGPEQYETLVGSRTLEFPVRKDMEAAVLSLSEAAEQQRHRTSTGLSPKHWSEALLQLEAQLLAFRDATLQQHNKRVLEAAQKASSTSQLNPSDKFKKLCLRALDVLAEAIENPYYHSGKGEEHLKSIVDRLEFLFLHLAPEKAHLVYQQAEQESVTTALQFIVHQTRRFLDEEFDEFFLQAVGELWAAEQVQDSASMVQMEFDNAVEGRWDSLSLRVLSAAYVVG